MTPLLGTKNPSAPVGDKSDGDGRAARSLLSCALWRGMARLWRGMGGMGRPEPLSAHCPHQQQGLSGFHETRDPRQGVSLARRESQREFQGFHESRDTRHESRLFIETRITAFYRVLRPSGVGYTRLSPGAIADPLDAQRSRCPARSPLGVSAFLAPRWRPAVARRDDDRQLGALDGRERRVDSARLRRRATDRAGGGRSRRQLPFVARHAELAAVLRERGGVQAARRQYLVGPGALRPARRGDAVRSVPRGRGALRRRRATADASLDRSPVDLLSLRRAKLPLLRPHPAGGGLAAAGDVPLPPRTGTRRVAGLLSPAGALRRDALPVELRGLRGNVAFARRLRLDRGRPQVPAGVRQAVGRPGRLVGHRVPLPALGVRRHVAAADRPLARRDLCCGADGSRPRFLAGRASGSAGSGRLLSVLPPGALFAAGLDRPAGRRLSSCPLVVLLLGLGYSGSARRGLLAVRRPLPDRPPRFHLGLAEAAVTGGLEPRRPAGGVGPVPVALVRGGRRKEQNEYAALLSDRPGRGIALCPGGRADPARRRENGPPRHYWRGSSSGPTSTGTAPEASRCWNANSPAMPPIPSP